MSNLLRMKFWDVQHGNATHIRTPNNRVVVIDMGDGESPAGTSARFSPLNYLRFHENTAHIDRLVITHPHRDHLDDIENVIALSPTVLMRPAWLTEEEVRKGNKQEDTAKISQYFQLASTFNSPVTRPHDVSIPEDWGGVSFRHYISSAVPRTNLNNHSVVTVVSYQGLQALIPGDNEAPSWNELLKQPAFKAELPNIHVLLAPHHGRDAGYCYDLFAAGLNPYITIISDDQHGSTSVTTKYAAQTKGWDVLKSDGTREKRYCVTTRANGTITVEFWADNQTKYIEVAIERG